MTSNDPFRMPQPQARSEPGVEHRKGSGRLGLRGDPMTGAQVSYLKTLAEEAHEPDAFSERLTKAEASKRIEVLKAKLKLFDGPPHAA